MILACSINSSTAVNLQAAYTRLILSLLPELKLILLLITYRLLSTLITHHGSSSQSRKGYRCDQEGEDFSFGAEVQLCCPTAAGSAIPYRRAPPKWLKVSPEEVADQIFKVRGTRACSMLQQHMKILLCTARTKGHDAISNRHCAARLARHCSSQISDRQQDPAHPQDQRLGAVHP